MTFQDKINSSMLKQLTENTNEIASQLAKNNELKNQQNHALHDLVAQLEQISLTLMRK